MTIQELKQSFVITGTSPQRDRSAPGNEVYYAGLQGDGAMNKLRFVKAE